MGLGEKGVMGPRFASLVRDDEDQENPALEASTSGVLIRGGTGHKDYPTGETA